MAAMDSTTDSTPMSPLNPLGLESTLDLIMPGQKGPIGPKNKRELDLLNVSYGRKKILSIKMR